MSITGAIVMYAVTWFMVFYMVLTLRVRSQADTGQVEPGTPKSAPADAKIVQRAKLTTIIATVIWALLAGTILSGRIGINDLDVFGVLGWFRV